MMLIYSLKQFTAAVENCAITVGKPFKQIFLGWSFHLSTAYHTHVFCFLLKIKKTNIENVMLINEWKAQGFINEPFAGSGSLGDAIRQLCKEKEAVILAHYYTLPEVQEVADFIGDSLALARKAADCDAKIIVMAGVHFMAETCSLLSPDKLVLCPDLNAGCSLADSCPADELRKMKEQLPGHTVVSYVNTTAAVKALTDVVVTSGNAKKIVDQLPQDEPIIFGPDYNLGHYINGVTGRNMVLWRGGCHVHERFQADTIKQMKEVHPDAIVLVHPESRAEVVALADVVGSTAVLLKEAEQHPEREYIVVTEAGILCEMRRRCPHTIFMPVPVEGACNECEHMKRNTLLKIYNCLRYEWPSVKVDPEIAREAVKPIERMLSMS